MRKLHAKTGNPRLHAVGFGKATKKSVVATFFGNFIPNFREQMATDKHYSETKTKRKHP